MLRKLGNFEKALFISDQHAPFNVVSVLRLENAPAPEHLRQSLEALQKRHPFLRARINNWRFESLSQPAIELTVLKPSKETNWMKHFGENLMSRGPFV